jgi:MFS family permease
VSIVSATLSRTERRAYEANIWKLFLYTFLMDFQLWWPLWVVYLRETRGFSLTQVTVLDAPFWLVIVFAEVPTGAVADRWGRKWSLLLGAVSFSWAIVVFGLSSNYALILVSYLGWAVALTLQSGANSALLFDSLKALGREGDFERLTGSLFAVMSAAGLGGILLGAPFAAATNLATPIVVSGLIAVFAAPVAFSMKEPPIAEHERSENYVGLLRDSVSLVRSRPAVLRMLVYAALIGVAAFAPVIFVQPFLRLHGVSIGNLGFLQTPNRVMTTAGALLAYRASALLGGRSLFAVLPAVMVASYCLLGAWGSVYAYVAFLPIAAMQGFSRPATGNYIHQRIPSGQRATILSFSQLLFSLALAPVEPALGFIADRWGLQRVFWTLALGTAAVGGGAYLWWLRADDDAHELVPSEGPRAPGSFEGTEDAEQTGAGRLP